MKGKAYKSFQNLSLRGTMTIDRGAFSIEFEVC